MAHSVTARKQNGTLLAIPGYFGIACFLAILIFLPYTLLLIFSGSLPINADSGVGSPAGGLSGFFATAPWPAFLVALCFALFIAGKLFRDRQLIFHWKASMLFLLIFLLLSAFLLWQAPLVPSLNISPDYYVGFSTMVMGIYPCFFAALTSVFLYKQHSQQNFQKTGWAFIPLSVPAAVAGSALCYIAMVVSASSYLSYYEGHLPSPYSPLMVALRTLPTLFAISLSGGFLGNSLYRWLQYAFGPPQELDPYLETGEPTNGSTSKEVFSQSSTWASKVGICWGSIWRIGLAGLMSVIITGILLDTSTSIISGGIFPDVFWNHVDLNLGLYSEHGGWYLPPFFAHVFSGLFTSFYQLFILIFLPFLLVLPGVLVERRLWRRRTILPELGIILIFLAMGIGAKDLILSLLNYLNSFWYSGFITAIFYCGTTLCETTTLALLAALTLGNFSKSGSKWSKRLLWLLIGIGSFAGSTFPLMSALQYFTYQASSQPPFQSVPLDTTTIAIVLVSGLVLSLLAAWFGGWLRSLLTGRIMHP